MRRHRQDLLTRARGRTLEIGSGTGLNLAHYPDDLDGLVLAEPDPSMRKRLENAVRRSEHNAQVIDARAEQLPFADASIDTVVSTLVLCTVDAPDLALREIARVLRPGGQLLFIEHVRSDSPRLARWQDRLARPWQRFAEGCRCNRATLELMDACGFQLDARPAAWRAMPPIIRPLAIGRATIAATRGQASVVAVRVGTFLPLGQPAAEHGAALARAADVGVDHVCVGDHVSFFVGAGSDGLITATSLLSLQAELPVYIGLYLLPLRHPVPVARQLASIAELAPGRLTFGVGIGGEDRHEVEICGVDPQTRGRRMDECLQILRALSGGEPVNFDGEFFSLADALIVPAPAPRIPLMVGGRSGGGGAARRDDSAMAGSGFGSRRGGSRRWWSRSARRPPPWAETREASIMRSTSGAVLAPPGRLRVSRSLPVCRPSTRCHSSPSSATRPTVALWKWRSSCARTSRRGAQHST